VSEAPSSGTAEWYSRFARLEARGQSPIYEELASGVALDPELLALIDELPRLRRQPNLVLACSRLLGAPVDTFAAWREWVIAHWPAVQAEASVRLTQTNEARRCTALLPVLASIEGPIALLEVGASAGLCLYPDRYSYRFDGVPLDPVAGPSAVVLEASTNAPPPTRMPDIVWRAGIDLKPLDVSDADDARWLETLIWPEQHERLARLRGAMDIVRADPPLMVRGDATSSLAELAASAPAGATLVVVSSGVLVYLVRAEREAFATALRSLDARWLSLEAAALFPALAEQVTQATGLESLDGRFALALDDRALALVGPHGQFVEWFAGVPGSLGLTS
jgi:hypothetical protein